MLSLFLLIFYLQFNKSETRLHTFGDYNSYKINSYCITSFNTTGKCLYLFDCANYKEYIKNSIELKMCFWIENIPVVCCPSASSSSNSFMTTKATFSSVPSRYTTIPSFFPQHNKATENKWIKTQRPSLFSTSKRRKTIATMSTIETAYTFTPDPEPEPIKAIKIRSSISNCGTRRKNDKNVLRIIGGVDAYENEFPWIAAIFMRNFDGSLNHECAGSIISDQYILTAAHCFSTKIPTHYIIGIGNNYIRNTMKLQVESIIIHPGFNQDQFYNDIALIKTKEKINFTDSIRPICLPDEYDIIEDKVIISGWGHTEYNGEPSEKLLKANLKLVNRKECNQTYYSLRSSKISKGITKHFLCAGTEDGSKDACQNDSGGSLIAKTEAIDHNEEWESRFVQIGIVSFGYQCAVKGYPGVYTNVSLYTDWLKKNVPFSKSNAPYLGEITRRDRIG